MDVELNRMGYKFLPPKSGSSLGYSGLVILFSERPAERFFDVKALHLPTFDGRFYHQTQVTRHELSPVETFQVCMGLISLNSFRGESLRAFSFGGVLNTSIQAGDLHCELTSSAPLFQVREDPVVIGGVIVDEIMDLLAESEARLPGQQNELYSRLAMHDPYKIFLATLISLQKRADAVPTNLRRARYRKFVAEIRRAIQSVKKTDGWDGNSPSLADLLAEGGG